MTRNCMPTGADWGWQTPRLPLISLVTRLPREFSRKPAASFQAADWPLKQEEEEEVGNGGWGYLFPVHTSINQESNSLAQELGGPGWKSGKEALQLAPPGWLLPHKMCHWSPRQEGFWHLPTLLKALWNVPALPRAALSSGHQPQEFSNNST